MEFLGFTPCKADADVWMQEVKNSNGANHWEYVLLYVDNCLSVSLDPESIIRNEIGKYFKVKEPLVGELGIYLGGKVHKVELETSTESWAFGLSQYIQETCRNAYMCLKERHEKKNDSSQFFLLKNPAKGLLSNKLKWV